MQLGGGVRVRVVLDSAVLTPPPPPCCVPSPSLLPPCPALQAPTCFGGIPTSLCVGGSTLTALDLLASATLFHLPSLAPLSADLEGRHLTCLLPLGHLLLAGAQGGLLALQRDEAAEANMQADGGDGRGGGSGHPPSAVNLAPLRYVATCRRHILVAGMVGGQLGVAVRRLQDLGCDDGRSSQAPAAVVVGTSGEVLSVHLLHPHQHQALAAAVDLPQQDVGCLDGGALVAAFTQPDWLHKLARERPEAAVREGCAVLESLGLL